MPQSPASLVRAIKQQQHQLIWNLCIRTRKLQFLSKTGFETGFETGLPQIWEIKNCDLFEDT